MKRILFVFGMVVLMMERSLRLPRRRRRTIINGGDAGHGGGVSPPYLANQDGRANEGCTILITLNADGSITITAPNPALSTITAMTTT